MAVLQANPRTVQAPPELPNLPGDSPQLTQYLRGFALWCRHGFADKVSATVAQPGSMMLAHDAGNDTPNVFKFQVSQAGVASIAPMALGTADPSGTGAPVPLVNEAPVNGGLYGRSNGAWTAAMPASGGGFDGPITAPSVTITGALNAGSGQIFGSFVVVSLTVSSFINVQTMSFSLLPVNAANDAAAASAGVPVGGVYRNGSALMVRIA